MSNPSEINENMVKSLLELSSSDILELINTAGVVAVIMETDKIDRIRMGTALLAFAHKALSISDCHIITKMFDPETKISVHYVNGEKIE